jgi:hypothetical protein
MKTTTLLNIRLCAGVKKKRFARALQRDERRLGFGPALGRAVDANR